MDTKKIDKLIEKKKQEAAQFENRIKDLEEKLQKINNEIENLENRKSSLTLKQLNITLNENGITLNEIFEALKDSKLDTLQEKILEYKLDAKKRENSNLN